MTDLVLLGPQRHHPHILESANDCGMAPPWAVITAGWQEREAETEELEAHLGARVVNLNLYQRAEEVFQEDPLLREAIRQHQMDLIALQELYRLRLRFYMQTVHQLLGKKKPESRLLQPEIDDSFRALQALDQHHLNRIRDLNASFFSQWQLRDRPKIKKHREEIQNQLSKCSTLLIAGGHVAILLNRIRLFGLESAILEKPCIAWSAGAMVLGDSILLFHDSPPQGRGYAEVFETGFGRYKHRLVFPHAKKRLLLDDPIRVQMLTRRFLGTSCWTLDDHASLTYRKGIWQPNHATLRLSSDGSYHPEVTS